MKLILDEGLPLRAAGMLREAGVEAWHVLELNMGGASDLTILEQATVGGAVIATLDADFHRHLAITGAERPSVIRIRIEGLGAASMAELLLHVLGQTGEVLGAGAIVTVAGHRIRFRKLPINS